MTREETKRTFEDLRGHKITLSDLSVNEQEEICDIAISALSAEGEYISKEDISRVLLERIGANESCLRNARELKNHEAEQYFNKLVFEDEQIVSLIEELPSADVRPNIHGHWELKYPTREEMIYCQERYFCSNCKNYVVDRIAKLEFNFCPNCGADMRDPKGILRKAIDNTTFAEEAYPNIKEELHKAIDMAESEGTE